VKVVSVNKEDKNNCGCIDNIASIKVLIQKYYALARIAIVIRDMNNYVLV